MAARPGGVLCFPVVALGVWRGGVLLWRTSCCTGRFLFLRASSGLGVVRISSGKLGRLASCADGGMFLSPLCCVFRVVGLVTGDGRWFPPAILGVGVDDTHLVIQVHLGSGSTAPGLAAVSMLWGSSSASVGGWSSSIGHGGWRCFSFVSCPWWIEL
jgi:hypothetical protein